jgi:TonB family protein
VTHRYQPPDFRGAQTPLILWICAAICAHFVMAEGGDQVAQVHDDHKALQEFAQDVRQRVGYVAPEVDIDLGAGRADLTAPPAPPPEEQKTEEQKKKEEEKKKEEAKKEEEKKKPEVPVAKQVEKKEDKTLPVPPLELDKRIAVKQHAKPNQEDNPNAKFIGNEANHVDKESVATITSHDQDDVNPTPGGNHQNSDKSVGDSENTKIAESDYHKGEKDKGPGEKGTEFDLQPMPPTDKPMTDKPIDGPVAKLPPQSGGDGRTQMSPQQQEKTEVQPQGNNAQPTPDVVEAPGGWMFQNPQTGGGGNDGRPGVDPRQLQPPTGNNKPMFGLGGQPVPGRPNLNLTQSGVVAIVGTDQLRKEREADGERRKSEHRGSWQASNFEKWRSAIENYVSSVKPGNQTALNTAAVPFATYLNSMHNRIHPIFADSFLASLDSLPNTHPLNDMHLITRLEIILTKEGRLVKMGIVKTSGNTAFDIAALDSVERAQPFGPAPNAIISPDNKVYLHWEFHRDEVYACSTMNARPFILKNAPNENEQNPAPGPGKTNPGKERIPVDSKETREGLLDIRKSRTY